MVTYTAITFAPVQGFIEKSRKLRDLYGASLILSYLSQQLVLYVEKTEGLTLISPGIPTLQKGMPNRILINGYISKDDAKNILLSAWKDILQVCRDWIRDELRDHYRSDEYYWEREWSLWGSHTWEIFQGSGCCIPAAIDDLETNKLCRDWTAVNWIGESSSLTGIDAIAFPGLGAETRNPKNINHDSEKKAIKDFYTHLARKLDNCPPDKEPEGKYIAPNEKLSIPELVKRLITWPKIADLISDARPDSKPLKKLSLTSEIQRKPQPDKNLHGQWTGWFMGDGDQVGDHLTKLSNRDNGDEEIKRFSEVIRHWGEEFDETFAEELRKIINASKGLYKDIPEELGRIIYAGGDDFLGIIYSGNPNNPIRALTAYQWLMTLKNKWQEPQHGLNVSVGFVWVAGSVPQRDILQHCREAEKLAKSLGRDRVTIRIVFNSGQYVQWTCPWKYLDILTKYRDINGKTFAIWEHKGGDEKYYPNWSHIYSDLAQLKSRHAFGLSPNKHYVNVNKDNILINLSCLIDFLDGYFPGCKDDLKQQEKYLVCGNKDPQKVNRINHSAPLMITWIEDLITVGWHLFRSGVNYV